jgi:hypothetical protein
MLRSALLLPPRRLLTPRSARRLSPTDRGLLPGARALTRVGLTPTGLIQLSGRNKIKPYFEVYSVQQLQPEAVSSQ